MVIVKKNNYLAFVRDPRLGLGRRDLGRTLLKQSGCITEQIVQCGRYDDLWHIATENMIYYLHAWHDMGDNLCQKVDA